MSKYYGAVFPVIPIGWPIHGMEESQSIEDHTLLRWIQIVIDMKVQMQSVPLGCLYGKFHVQQLFLIVAIFFDVGRAAQQISIVNLRKV
jgi:hypothetical protein